MTRYARTNEGVYQILREAQISKDIIKYDVKPNKKLEYHIFNSDIIKESDNLEDLIDEYIAWWKDEKQRKLYGSKNKKCIYYQDINLDKLFLKMSHSLPGLAVDYMNIYGAIWTDRGLIYVAKMNKNEEWELI